MLIKPEPMNDFHVVEVLAILTVTLAVVMLVIVRQAS